MLVTSQRFAVGNSVVTLALLVLNCIAIAVADVGAADHHHHCIHDEIKAETVSVAHQLYEARTVGERRAPAWVKRLFPG